MLPDERVSVVVITHNRCQELDRTLRRLAKLPERPAVVVVDNASADDTVTVVRSRHPDVTLFTPGENLGAVRGLPWVLRERRPVPPDMDRGYRQLEDMQLNGGRASTCPEHWSRQGELLRSAT